MVFSYSLKERFSCSPRGHIDSLKWRGISTPCVAWNPDLSVSVPSTQSQNTSDSLLAAGSLASACAWGSRNATHAAATVLPLPLINPARVLAEGGQQMLGLCGPLQGPHREGCHSHTKPHSIQAFSPFPEFKVFILTSFYRNIIDMVLPPLLYRGLTPSEHADLFSIIYISVLTQTVCNADSRPVIRVPEGSRRKTLLIFHPDLNGFLTFLVLYTHFEGHKVLYKVPEVDNIMRQDCITSRLYHQRLLIFLNLQFPSTPPSPWAPFFFSSLQGTWLQNPRWECWLNQSPRLKNCYVISKLNLSQVSVCT